MRSRAARLLVVVATAVTMMGALLVGASASTAAQPSYLFVVDATTVTVTPGKGFFAKIEVMRPRTTAFTDRPQREASRVSTVAMLEAFGWSDDSRRLRHYPNAAVAIDGTSHVVEVRRAAKTPGRVVLWVRSLSGPLDRMTGPGTVFIDNAPLGYDTPTLVEQFPQFNYTLFALAGLRDQVTIRVVSGAVLSPDGTWSGGTTGETITISPEQPNGSLAWATPDGEATWDLDFQLQPAQDGLLVTFSGTQTVPGGSIPILNQSAFVPSYWCASLEAC